MPTTDGSRCTPVRSQILYQTNNPCINQAGSDSSVLLCTRAYGLGPVVLMTNWGHYPLKSFVGFIFAQYMPRGFRQFLSNNRSGYTFPLRRLIFL